MQATLPKSAKDAKAVHIVSGSGATVAPLWAEQNGAVCEGCQLVLQLNVNFHMRLIPGPMMNFLLKVCPSRPLLFHILLISCSRQCTLHLLFPGTTSAHLEPGEWCGSDAAAAVIMLHGIAPFIVAANWAILLPISA